MSNWGGSTYYLDRATLNPIDMHTLLLILRITIHIKSSLLLRRTEAIPRYGGSWLPAHTLNNDLLAGHWRNYDLLLLVFRMELLVPVRLVHRLGGIPVVYSEYLRSIRPLDDRVVDVLNYWSAIHPYSDILTYICACLPQIRWYSLNMLHTNRYLGYLLNMLHQLMRRMKMHTRRMLHYFRTHMGLLLRFRHLNKLMAEALTTPNRLLVRFRFNSWTPMYCSIVSMG